MHTPPPQVVAAPDMVTSTSGRSHGPRYVVIDRRVRDKQGHTLRMSWWSTLHRARDEARRLNGRVS
jgi:hypothetical protein